MIRLVVGPKARRPLTGFFGGGIGIFSVPIIVDAAGQGGGYGVGGHRRYDSIRTVGGVKNDIVGLNAIVNKISIAIRQGKCIIAAGVVASHFNRGKVLAGCG